MTTNYRFGGGKEKGKRREKRRPVPPLQTFPYTYTDSRPMRFSCTGTGT